MTIHPTAIIEPGATIGENVSIGAYCHVGKNVTLHDHVTLLSHVVVDGYTSVGSYTRIFPFASIGSEPQDLKFHGEKTTLEIGEHNIIREHVTMNPGTEGGGSKTIVGNNGLFMVGVHIAHDCHVGNRVIMANNASLAGHVTVDDYVIMGGFAAVHQFVRIGKHAMIGGGSRVRDDIIPYALATSDQAELSGLNLIGMKRRGFKREDIHSLRAAYRKLFSKENILEKRLENLTEEFAGNTVVEELIAFVQEGRSRSLCQPRSTKSNVA